MELKKYVVLMMLGHKSTSIPTRASPIELLPGRLASVDKRYRPKPTDLVTIDNPIRHEWESKTCTDPGVIDASKPSSERWELLGASWALDSLMGEWLDNKIAEQTHITFVEWISNKYHGPEGLDCGKIANDPCTEIIQCDQVDNPAVYFLLNSSSTLHSLARSARNEMDIARGDISLGTFMETFCPAKKPDMSLEIFKSIVDTVLLGGMMGSAFLWNKAIKTGGVLTGDNRGYLKDNFNAAMAYSFNMLKDNQKGPKDLTAAKTKMEEQMQIYFQEMMKLMETTNEFMFKGDQDGINALVSATWEGKALPNNNRGIDAGAFNEELKTILYSQMIPKAWYENPEGTNVPLVLETDDACDGSNRAMTDPAFGMETAEKTRVCLEGVTYYVLGSHVLDPCINQEACADQGSAFFHVLPGGSHDDLNGSRWGKITLEDIVRSVRDGWIANGNKNGFKPNPEPNQNDLSSFFDGLTWIMPGHWTVPFCPKDRWDSIVRRVAGLEGADKFWPCGE